MLNTKDKQTEEEEEVAFVFLPSTMSAFSMSP